MLVMTTYLGGDEVTDGLLGKSVLKKKFFLFFKLFEIFRGQTSSNNKIVDIITRRWLYYSKLRTSYPEKYRICKIFQKILHCLFFHFPHTTSPGSRWNMFMLSNSEYLVPILKGVSKWTHNFNTLFFKYFSFYAKDP